MRPPRTCHHRAAAHFPGAPLQYASSFASSGQTTGHLTAASPLLDSKWNHGITSVAALPQPGSRSSRGAPGDGRRPSGPPRSAAGRAGPDPGLEWVTPRPTFLDSTRCGRLLSFLWGWSWGSASRRMGPFPGRSLRRVLLCPTRGVRSGVTRGYPTRIPPSPPRRHTRSRRHRPRRVSNTHRPRVAGIGQDSAVGVSVRQVEPSARAPWSSPGGAACGRHTSGPHCHTAQPHP